MARQNNTIHSIQYLRAVAAILVVFHHAFTQIDIYSPFFDNIKFGAQGVDIFFVISGFIIWYVTADSKMSKTDFLLRRLIRVAPIYWVVTLAIILLALVAPQLFKSTQFGLSEVVKSLLFIPHYNLAFPDSIFPILVPGWTLNYEMFFYIVFFFVLFSKSRMLLLTCLFTGLVIVGYFVQSTNPLFVTYTNTMLLEFLLGAIIANVFLQNTQLSFSPSIAILMMSSGAVLLVIFTSIIPQESFRGIIFGIPAAMIVFSALMLERSRKMIKNRIFHELGDASYSIYLTHLFTLGIYRVIWNKMISPEASIGEAAAFIISATVLSCIVGLWVYRHIEIRLLQFFKNLLIKKQAPQST